MSLTIQRSKEEQLVKILKALSDETRLKIIAKMAKKETSCANLGCDFDITAPTMSHHLKILQECGLLLRRKEGQMYYNSLNHDLYNKVIETMGDLIK